MAPDEDAEGWNAPAPLNWSAGATHHPGVAPAAASLPTVPGTAVATTVVVQGVGVAQPAVAPVSAPITLTQCLSFTGMKLVYCIFLILLALVWYSGMRKWYVNQF